MAEALQDPRVFAGPNVGPANAPELQDPRMFGGPADGPLIGEIPGGRVIGTGASATPVPLRNLGDVDTSTFGEGSRPALLGAQIQEGASRIPVGVLESTQAALQLTDTAALLNATLQESFPAEPGFSPAVAREQLSFVPSDDESRWLDKSKSNAEWASKVQRLQYLREAGQKAGDNPVASALTMMAGDVVYWLTGVGAYAAAARAGRGVGFAVGGASGVGITQGAQLSTPKSDTEVVLGVLGELAVPAFVVRKVKPIAPTPGSTTPIPGTTALDLGAPSKPFVPSPPVEVVRKDPDFPAEELQAALTPQKQSQPIAVPVPRALVTSKPNYGFRDTNFALQFADDLDKAAYIVAGKGKSAAHEEILSWAIRATGQSESAVIAAGNAIRADLKVQAKAGALLGDVPATGRLQAKAALDNPDARADTPLRQQYDSIVQATQDLAQNATAPYIREVMRVLAPHVPEGRVRQFDRADPTIADEIKAVVNDDTRAITAVDLDGPTELLVQAGKGVGEETLAHEILHAATIRKLATNPELRASFDGLVKNVQKSLREAGDDVLSKEERAFFERAFGDEVPDADEFLAYALTSPSFQKVLDKMDAAGNWSKATKEPAKLTAFQKIAHLIAKLFGAGTKAGINFEQAMRTSRASGKTLRDETMRRLQKVLDDPMHPDNPVLDRTKVAQAVGAIAERQAKSFAERTGEKLQWNIRKTMAGFSDVGRKVADLLFDNNSDLSKTSVESHHRAVKAELTNLHWKYEDQLREALAKEGIGTRQFITDTSNAQAKQAAIERAVHMEMLRRGQLTRKGQPVSFEKVPPHIKEMADSLDKLYKRAAQELTAAGVQGAEELQHTTGFVNRRWDSGKIMKLQDELEAAGMSAKQAHQQVVRMVASGMRRANGWDDVLSYNVAAATVNRALRKGNFEDAALSPNFGNNSAAQVRDLLTEEGLSGPELQRVMDVLVGKQDEAAKAGFLKHRVDVDYNAGLIVNGRSVSVADLLDHSVNDIVSKYIDGASTQVAFARNGLKSQSDIIALRQELIDSLKGDPKQADAVNLFDESLKYMRGEATGSDIGQGMRNLSVVTRMIALRNSGLWQLTEYATAMGKFGALKTIKNAIAELPGFRSLLGEVATDPAASRNLKDILSTMSEQNLRMRPFVKRFEDGFEVDPSSTLSLKLQQAGQLVPYINGMKYVHAHQARMTSNLILDVITKASTGDTKAAGHLAKYGIDPNKLKGLSEAVKAHGFNVDKWPDKVWSDVRPTFAKMMDESVLHQRLGDTPAFALLNPVGKFIFTYRSFVLTAHNKVLAGSVGRDGLAGASLIMLYQAPMAALAVQAQTTIQAKEPLTTSELASKSMGQMGAIGLFSEVWGWVSGDKKQVGSPGLIAIDRGIGLVGDTSAALQGGSWGKVGSDVLSVLPLVALLPGSAALGNLAKESD